jgi:hypothetical protein
MPEAAVRVPLGEAAYRCFAGIHAMPRFIAFLTLSLVLVPGCRRVSTTPEPVEPALGLDSQREVGALEPKPTGAVAAEPACSVSLDWNGELTVGGQPIPIELERTERMRIRSFPHGDGSILLALGSETPWLLFEDDFPNETLWELPCDRPSEVRELITIEGADFAWAEMDPDGSGLYFSLGAVQRYDFALRDYGPVTTPAEIRECWMEEGPVTAIEFVAGWVGDDRLLIYSGGPCGFEAEWEGGTSVIENPRTLAKRRASAYVGSIAADASGRVWVGDGGRCAEPQTVWDRGSPGVWRSDDAGASWTFVPIPVLADPGRGVDAIWTTAKEPGRVWVHSGCCYSGPSDECDGGERLHSDDGGRSWTLVDRSGKPGSGPLGPRSVTLDGWVIDATLDGVVRRRAGQPSGAGELVLMPGK